MHLLIPKAEARHGPWPEVLQQHIAFRYQFARDRLTLGHGDIQRQRFLAAVGRAEIGRVLRLLTLRVADPRRTERTRIVAWPGPLHLDHFYAEIGEVLARPRPGEDAREIENADAPC